MSEFSFWFTSGRPISAGTAWVFNLDRDGNIVDEEQARKDMEFEKFMERLNG